MKAIYKRELKSYFCSFTGWLFVAVNLFMMGLYFIVYNMLIGYPTIAYVPQSIAFTFIVTIPILTMRVLSEERKNRTDQLILTAPVSVGKIVLGKYLALLTVLALPVAFMGVLPFFLMQGGEVQLGVSYASLLGFSLWQSGSCDWPFPVGADGECGNRGGAILWRAVFGLYHAGHSKSPYHHGNDGGYNGDCPYSVMF